MDAAALASRSNQDAAAASDGSVTLEDPPDASAEGAPDADQPTIGEITPAAAAEAEAAADVVLDLDRELGREVQAALNAAGFAVGRPDGLIGTRSKKVIADWQATQGHAATGALTRSQASNLLGRSLP
jgi:peptidoglycan hydrolase-like protein with peptidoglycan-binding domain